MVFRPVYADYQLKVKKIDPAKKEEVLNKIYAVKIFLFGKVDYFIFVFQELNKISEKIETEEI